jgi:hypothetical protein
MRRYREYTTYNPNSMAPTESKTMYSIIQNVARWEQCHVDRWNWTGQFLRSRHTTYRWLIRVGNKVFL